MASKSNFSVVLDIGTSKMVAVAGYKNDSGNVEIAGTAKTVSKGIRRGVVFNIEEVAACVKQVLAELESKVQEKITKVSVAYSGQHFKTVSYRGTKITSDEGVVSQFDIDHLFNEAKKAEIEAGYQIIEVIPGSFVIDGEAELNPVGITGRNIVANYKLVICPEEYLLNIERVFDRVGIELGEIKLSSLAVSEAVITEDEKELGVIVLDIGAGTTNFAVFHENELIQTGVVPFGGEVVTRDIKEGCSILLKWAEQLKVQYGQALGDFADDQKVVTIPSYNGWEPKEISFKSLAFIIQAQVEEIVEHVFKQIEKAENHYQMRAGVVITGGTSNLDNIVSLVKFRSGMDVRKANLVIHFNQKNKEILNAENYTALGLLKIVLEKTTTPETVVKKVKKEKKKKESSGGGLSPWFNKVVQGVLDMVDDDNEDVAMN